MDTSDEAALSEHDIRSRFITPAIDASGWNIHRQRREQVNLTDARALQARLTSALVDEVAA